eukprot:172466_1
MELTFKKRKQLSYVPHGANAMHVVWNCEKASIGLYCSNCAMEDSIPRLQWYLESKSDVHIQAQNLTSSNGNLRYNLLTTGGGRGSLRCLSRFV